MNTTLGVKGISNAGFTAYCDDNSACTSQASSAGKQRYSISAACLLTNTLCGLFQPPSVVFGLLCILQ